MNGVAMHHRRTGDDAQRQHDGVVVAACLFPGGIGSGTFAAGGQGIILGDEFGVQVAFSAKWSRMARRVALKVRSRQSLARLALGIGVGN